MALGVRDTRSEAWSSNVDLAELDKYRTADGVGLGELGTLVQAGLTAFNGFQWGTAYAKIAELIAMTCARKRGPSGALIHYSTGNIAANDETETGDEAVQRTGDADAMVKVYKKTNRIGYTLQDLRRVTSERVPSDIGRAIDGHKEALR